MSASKETISELVIVFIAILLGVALYSPIAQYCSAAAADGNTTALTKTFIQLIPFAYILIVFIVGIAVVIKLLK